jgi:hypothetical protein
MDAAYEYGGFLAGIHDDDLEPLLEGEIRFAADEPGNAWLNGLVPCGVVEVDRHARRASFRLALLLPAERSSRVDDAYRARHSGGNRVDQSDLAS